MLKITCTDLPKEDIIKRYHNCKEDSSPLRFYRLLRLRHKFIPCSSEEERELFKKELSDGYQLPHGSLSYC